MYWLLIVIIYIWYWPIANFKVRIRNISNENFFEIVKDDATITIAIKYEIIYGLSIDMFTFEVDQF